MWADLSDRSRALRSSHDGHRLTRRSDRRNGRQELVDGSGDSLRGGAARAPSMHNLFPIADVDLGVIRWINADLEMGTRLGAG